MSSFIRTDLAWPARVMVSDTNPGEANPTTGLPKWDAMPPYRDFCATKGMPTLIHDDAGKRLSLPAAWSPDIEIPHGEFWVTFGLLATGTRHVRWHGPYKVQAAEQAFSLIQTPPQHREASIVHLELELL